MSFGFPSSQRFGFTALVKFFSGGGGVPANALTLNGQVLTLNGQTLTLGA